MPPRVPYFWAPMAGFGYILAETAVFIAICGKIGILAALFLALLSFLFGLRLLQAALRAAAAQMRQSRGLPARRKGQNLGLRCLSAVLLIVPGFISSACGLALLLPPLQKAAAKFINPGRFIKILFPAAPAGSSGQSRRRRSGQSAVIDLDPEDYRVQDSENSRSSS